MLDKQKNHRKKYPEELNRRSREFAFRIQFSVFISWLLALVCAVFNYFFVPPDTGKFVRKLFCHLLGFGHSIFFLLYSIYFGDFPYFMEKPG